VRLQGDAVGDALRQLAPRGLARGYPLALADLESFGERVLNGSDGFPGARELAERLVTVPTHSLLSRGDLAAIEAWLG
jgi:hypothetical protein